MDYFDFDENKKQEKEIFVKTYTRNRKVLRYVMGFVFTGLGVLFLGLGISLMILLDLLPMISLAIVGGIYLISGIVFFIVFRPKDPNIAYEKYQKRLKEFKSIYSTSDASNRILMLEAKVKRLEEEIESLKKNNRY